MNLKLYFEDYSNYHRSLGNQITHGIGIPLIIVGLFGLLSQWVIFPGFSVYLQLDGGSLLWFLGGLWYLRLDFRLGASFWVLLAGFYFVGRAFPFSLNLSLFLLGWVFQGVGHAVFEKNSPAFFKTLVHLLIGPLWIFCKVIDFKSR